MEQTMLRSQRWSATQLLAAIRVFRPRLCRENELIQVTLAMIMERKPNTFSCSGLMILVLPQVRQFTPLRMVLWCTYTTDSQTVSRFLATGTSSPSRALLTEKSFTRHTPIWTDSMICQPERSTLLRTS